MKLTASDIVTAIGRLPRNRAYNYVSPETATKIFIDEVNYPEGPIWIRRYNPSKGKGIKDAKKESISSQMIWRIANAVASGLPINFDRVLGGSYNTRSALEALLSHTPEFYFSYPGRVEIVHSSSKIKRGHKHLIWRPDMPHPSGRIEEIKTNIVISEIPSSETIYEALTIPEDAIKAEIDIEIQRRHAQIQIALLMIGLQLGSRVWIAQNDRGIIYKNQRLAEIEGVIATLHDVQLLSAFVEAIRAAILIDCIWFRNNRIMPAVFEIEHTTGVRSGLVRMKNFHDKLPPFPTRWAIAAPDEDRNKVLSDASMEQFRDLNVKFMPYSSVEELYSLCQRRKLKGVTDEFLDCFMEECIQEEV